MPQAVILELLGRVISRVVHLGLRRHDLVEKLALSMLLARLHVGPRDGDRLPESSPALRRDDDHAGAWRTLEHEPPLVRREIGLSSHATVLSPVATTTQLRTVAPGSARGPRGRPGGGSSRRPLEAWKEDRETRYHPTPGAEERDRRRHEDRDRGSGCPTALRDRSQPAGRHRAPLPAADPPRGRSGAEGQRHLAEVLPDLLPPLRGGLARGARGHRGCPGDPVPEAGCGHRPGARPPSPRTVPVRLRRGEGPPGHLLADPEDGQDGEP